MLCHFATFQCFAISQKKFQLQIFSSIAFNIFQTLTFLSKVTFLFFPYFLLKVTIFSGLKKEELLEIEQDYWTSVHLRPKVSGKHLIFLDFHTTQSTAESPHSSGSASQSTTLGPDLRTAGMVRIYAFIKRKLFCS